MTTNNYTKFDHRLVGSFENYGKIISEVLEKYQIQNNIWNVYGEEFITSIADISRIDSSLLDPWLRPFPESSVKMAQTFDKPTKHVSLFTTVCGSKIRCNIYIGKLNSVDIICRICEKNTSCIECKKTKIKTIYYPPNHL